MAPKKRRGVSPYEAPLVAFALTTTVFVFGPSTSFVANRDEFSLGLPQLLAAGIPAALGVFVSIAVMLAVMQSRTIRVGTACFTAVALLFYLQRSFLVFDYGVFDGGSIDWGAFRGEAMLETVVWVGALGAAIYFRREFADRAVFVCLFLLLAQLTSLAYETTRTDGLWRTRAPNTARDEAFRFSSERNVVFLVLDAFQTSTFDLLAKLRALNVYDETFIVIAADHGIGGRKPFESVGDFHRSVDRALPLLLIKPVGSTGPLQRSTNPTRLSDIPKTIADAMSIDVNYAGASAFAAQEPRPRSYLHYVWQHRYWDEAHLPPLQEFVVQGPVRDLASWREGARLTAPGAVSASP